MDIEIFKKPDPSGSMYKESYLMKNFTKEYDFIINYNLLYKMDNIPFKEKVYLCINNITEYPKCINNNCNNNVKYKNSTIGYNKYCSNKCISSDINIIDKKIKNSLIKYGTTHPQKSEEVKNKTLKTNISIYGGSSPMSSIQIRDKSKITLMSNWGVDNPSKSKEILDKRIISFISNIENWKYNFKKTCIDRYGYENPMKLKEISNRSRNNSMLSRNNNLFNLINSKLDINKYTLLNIDFDVFKRSINIYCIKGHNFKINREQFYFRNKNKTEICTICNPICIGISGLEKKVVEFICNNYSGEILLNKRNIISPYEIDIYLPELKIGFEFNGLYWHSSEHKTNNYHFNKYKVSENVNINLYTIWEDDWLYKEDICKSYILNKIGKTTKSIFARKCEIKLVSYKDGKVFLNNNHLQGDCKSSIRIGLYFYDELVSIMTFGKLRLALGSENIDNVYELIRFCNKINTNIVGGASKLLSFFIKNYNPLKIKTYSDNLISNGSLYKKIGFDYDGSSRPGFWYNINGIRSHRFNWRKSKLVKMGYEITKTGEMIMSELGYYRIYNGGNKRWILNLNK